MLYTTSHFLLSVFLIIAMLVGVKWHIKLSKACCNKYHKPGNLKQEKFILSRFGVLEVFNQNVSKVMLSLKPLTESHILLLVSCVASNP